MSRAQAAAELTARLIEAHVLREYEYLIDMGWSPSAAEDLVEQACRRAVRAMKKVAA